MLRLSEPMAAGEIRFAKESEQITDENIFTSPVVRGGVTESRWTS